MFELSDGTIVETKSLHTIRIGLAKNCTHYCGRSKSYKNVGKDLSILGNPYFLESESSRNTVCDNYEKYFKKMVDDVEFDNALQIIKNDLNYGNIVLGCFCYPKRCHCETIKKYIEETL
jgi:hypothetical protein